ncbi:MAG: glycosyltransferase family 2 protein [Bacteroidia bacterium]
MTKPIVSVIIPCRNEVKYIKACLDAVLNNDYGIENIEIIIVDGISNDGSRECIREEIAKNNRIKLIDNKDQITPFAFNLGIQNATGDYIFIVGARQLIAKNYISTCVEILNSNKDIACVGGKVENIYENAASKLIASAMSSSFGVGVGNFRIKEEDCFVDTVGTPAYRRSIFDEVGLFDEELVRNQDDEFNFRLIKRGDKIFFTGKTGLKYFVRANFKNLYRQYFQYGYWKVYVNRKHKTITTIRQLVPAFFVLFLFTGFVLSCLNFYITILYLSTLLLYFVFAFVAAAAKADKISDIFKIIYTFLILHFSYGSGYLKGIFQFIILKRKNASQKNMNLSR